MGKNQKNDGSFGATMGSSRRRRRRRGDSPSSVTTPTPISSTQSMGNNSIGGLGSSSYTYPEGATSSSVITTQPGSIGGSSMAERLVAGALGAASLASTVAAATLGVTTNGSTGGAITSAIGGAIDGNATSDPVTAAATSALTGAVGAATGSGCTCSCNSDAAILGYTLGSSLGIGCCSFITCYMLQRSFCENIGEHEGQGVSTEDYPRNLQSNGQQPPPYSGITNDPSDGPPPYSSNDGIYTDTPPSYGDIFGTEGSRNARHYSGPDNPPPYGGDIELQTFSDGSGRGGLNEVVVTQPTGTRSSLRSALGSITNSPERTPGGNHPQRHLAPTR